VSAHPGPPLTPGAALRASGAGRPKLWFSATRPLYLLTSIIPALSGALVAVNDDDARWWLLAPALIALALLHAATNACNDVEDAARGLDPPDKLNNSGVFSTGLLTIGEGRVLYASLFGATLAIGVVLAVLQGPALLAIGIAGILGGWLYTGGPRPYKYDGLGDPFIIMLMGPLLTQGAYAAITGDGFHAPAFWLGFAPGFLIAAVLASNNLSDIEGDRAAGLKTMAIRLGFSRARVLYLAVLAAAFVTLPVLWATGLLNAWILLPLVLAGAGVARARQALAAPTSDDERLVALVPQTAQLHLLFSVLLCVAVVLARV
jgi:1,4-dihydroxy-2-naphthoate octaprenyltransferase